MLPSSTVEYKTFSGLQRVDILSPIIFLIVMDEIMRKSVNEGRRGITWGLNGVLEDLDFADDVYLHTVIKTCTIKLII